MTYSMSEVLPDVNKGGVNIFIKKENNPDDVLDIYIYICINIHYLLSITYIYNDKS